MPLIYITGAPGVGKTTLQKELSSRGYDARDLDDPMFGAPHNKVTGQIAKIPRIELRTAAWFKDHEWRVYPDVFKKLRNDSKDNDLIVLGVASTDSEILPMFDQIIYLDIDDESLSDRIKTRKGNDYGMNRFELDEILARFGQMKDLQIKGNTLYVVDAYNVKKRAVRF